MRYLLLAALVLCSCSQVPYTPAPAIAPVSVQPIVDSNARVKKGNQAIAKGNAAIGAQLEIATAKLDKAIIDGQQATIDKNQLDADLKDASAALDAATQQKIAQDATIAAQDQTITDQVTVINDFKAKDAVRQKLVDKQTGELTTSRAKIANYEVVENEINAYWGLGAFWYGIKRLGWHILILVAILAALGFLLNMFVPALQPPFAAIVKWFVAIPGVVVAFLNNLWPKKPPS